MKRTILICAALTFSAIIFAYWWIGGNPLHRWPYALCVSALPGIISYFVVKWYPGVWWLVALLYGALFFLIAGAVEFARHL